MRKFVFLAALVLATPAFAGDLTVDTTLGTTIDEVTSSLTAMGYEVRKSEMEDGEIEVYFVKGETMGEVYVNASTGTVTKLKMN